MSTPKNSTDRNFRVLSIAIMFALFFMIAFVTGYQNPLGSVIKKMSGDNIFLTQLGTFANFIAYAFMGYPAGKLLDDMLAIIGLDRTMVYIANIVKCRPPQNRDPLGVEQDACIGYLREQVTLLRPKLIVCLGRIAAMRLIREDFKITREHGQWVKKGGFELMAMYHPAALLRDPARRPDAFEDLMSLREKARAVCEHTPLPEKL